MNSLITNKSSPQKQNMTWLIEHTAKCPKCQTNIEKNEGCKHMTCRKCEHQFCWECLKPWPNHSDPQCSKIVKEKTGRAGKKEKITDQFKLYEKIINFSKYKNHYSKILKKTLMKTKKFKPNRVNVIKNAGLKDKNSISQQINNTTQTNKNLISQNSNENIKKKKKLLEDSKLIRILIEIENLINIANIYKDKIKKDEIPNPKKFSLSNLERLEKLFNSNLDCVGEEKGGYRLEDLLKLTSKFYQTLQGIFKIYIFIEISSLFLQN
jgi:hypothetical protein